MYLSPSTLLDAISLYRSRPKRQVLTGLLFIASFLCLLGSPASAGDWKKISFDTEGNSYFLDVASIRSEGTLLKYAWMPSLKATLQIAKGTGCPVCQEVRTAIIYNASDCNNNLVYKGLESKFYNAKGEFLWSTQQDPDHLKGKNPKPKSVFEKMHQEVCQVGASNAQRPIFAPPQS
ncbi:MAG: hypothetical protein K2X66_07535 [Cyanobacteria bacterium]|nr:hypothetical protein [Cyanobacteriota bacterium]